MRKYLLLLGIVAALAIPAVALAATLPDHFDDLIAAGNKCDNTKIPDDNPNTGNYAGAWYHFVLNQVSPDFLAGVKLHTTFDPAAQVPANDVSPSVVLKKVQHFYVFSAGELQGAFTTGVNPGADANLVLSGVECKKKAPTS